MRILIATDAWAPQVNGVVRTMMRVTEELRAMGHTVEVVAPDRFRTVALPTYREIRLAILPGRAVARAIDAFAPDFLHIATEGPVGHAARRHALRTGLRFTTSFHTRFAEYLSARLPVPLSWGYAGLRRFHGPSSAIMVATPSLHDDLAARGFANLVPWTRGVDLAAFSPDIPPAIGLPGPVFAYVGRVSVEKNIEAFLSLDLPGSKLVVGDGPALAGLKRRFPGVHFAGMRTGRDLAAHYAAADVFVFPSRTDTFGLVILEALACGVPVAAYPVTGPKDILAGSGAGIVDADLRKAALAALDLDPAQARAHALGYSWQAVADAFLDNLVHVRA